jgi:hypothetical protein
MNPCRFWLNAGTSSEERMHSYHQYLTHPVLSDSERAVILMQMAQAAYKVWAEAGGINSDYDALDIAEKERWGQAVRAAVRVMFRVMGEIAE